MESQSTGWRYSAEYNQHYRQWVDSQGQVQIEWQEVGEGSNTLKQFDSSPIFEPTNVADGYVGNDAVEQNSYLTEEILDIESIGNTLQVENIHKPPGQLEDYQDTRFYPVKNPGAFFTKGRVLAVEWSEPPGVSQVTAKSQPFQKTRFFVVTKLVKHHNHCFGVAIHTYGKRGCTKPSVNGKDHTIIYTSDIAPPLLQGESIVKDPIRVIPSKDFSLHPTSRVNFSKVYTIEHNWAVSNLGRVAPADRKLLETQFNDTLGWGSKSTQ
ncbi:MAG: hypothetical protein M1834_007764 [Cirrosporium novae-zelandiae]|nr:MAG: hypothetical protein M1834_007764 [Cirrosporium novae-zelandiae]